jgi:hypothetical protein
MYNANEGKKIAYVQTSLKVCLLLDSGSANGNTQNYWVCGLPPLASDLKSREHIDLKMGCFHPQMRGSTYSVKFFRNIGFLYEYCLCNTCSYSLLLFVTRVVRKIRFPRRCSSEEHCYVGYGDTGM